MTAALSIAAGRDFYVPAFEVRMLGGDSKLPPAVQRDVLQVSYRDSLDAIPTVDITVNNWDVGRRTFKYSDSDLFDPGKELSVAMGYHGPAGLRTMINGVIVSCRPSFPAAGAPTLTITAHSRLMRLLQHEQQPKPQDERTEGQVAEAIKAALNFELRLDPAASANDNKVHELSQGTESTLSFLLERARRIDYEVIVEELGVGRSRLYYGPTSGIAEVVHKLSYGSTLSEFQPALSTIDQVGSVTVFGWDKVSQEQITATARRADLKLKTVGTAAAQKAVESSFADRDQKLHDPCVQTKDEAEKVALGMLRDNAKALITSTGSVVGLPGLRAGTAVEIDKVGSRYQGRYFLTATTHMLGGGGYTTQFECRHE